MSFRQTEQYGELVQRIERITEVPMLLLAFGYLVVYVLEFFPDVPVNIHQDAQLVDNIIIAVFAAELVVRLAVANNRISYLVTHWVDVLIVVVPFLRPIRFLRLLRLAPFVLRLTGGLRQVMGRYRVAHVLTVGLLSVLLSSVLMEIFERGGDGHIKTFGDALWWAITTVTTVGYGDMVPVTAEGKAVAVFLMLIGISLFGVLTAGIAAYFVNTSQEEQGGEMREVTERINQLERRIEEQNRHLAALLGQNNRRKNGRINLKGYGRNGKYNKRGL